MKRARRALALLFVLPAVGCHAARESVTAGQVGCTPGEIAISDVSHDSGIFESSSSWRAQCRGRTFVCSRRDATNPWNDSWFSLPGGDTDVSCHAEEEPALPIAKRVARRVRPSSAEQPPRAPLGFSLGASSTQIAKHCRAAGRRYRQHSDSQAQCSGGAPSMGLTGDTHLRFCGEHLCSVELTSAPGDHWERHLLRLRSGLAKKYGEPSVLTGRVPDHCRGHAAFDRCVSEGVLQLRYSWRWTEGQLIHLVLGRPVTGPRRHRYGGRPALRLSYIHRSAGKM